MLLQNISVHIIIFGRSKGQTLIYNRNIGFCSNIRGNLIENVFLDVWTVFSMHLRFPLVTYDSKRYAPSSLCRFYVHTTQCLFTFSNRSLCSAPAHLSTSSKITFHFPSGINTIAIPNLPHFRNPSSNARLCSTHFSSRSGIAAIASRNAVRKEESRPTWPNIRGSVNALRLNSVRYREALWMAFVELWRRSFSRDDKVMSVGGTGMEGWTGCGAAARGIEALDCIGFLVELETIVIGGWTAVVGGASSSWIKIGFSFFSTFLISCFGWAFEFEDVGCGVGFSSKGWAVVGIWAVEELDAFFSACTTVSAESWVALFFAASLISV